MVAALGLTAVLGGATAVLAQQNPAGVHFAATAGQPFSGRVATFDEGAPEPPSAFSATIEWGDGTSMSSGTVTRIACPGALPDRTCYDVGGSHTYASPDTYLVVTRITGVSGTVRASATAAVSEPTTPTAAIAGPTRLTLGEPARFVAESQPPADSFQWDLDGDGSYETDTGSTPVVERSYLSGGDIQVGLLAGYTSAPDVNASLDVVVERPSLVGVRTKPAYPRIGKRFKLKLDHLGEADTNLELLSWRITGVKPTRAQSTINLGRGSPRGARRSGARAPKTIVVTKGEFATTKTALPLKISDPGYYPLEVTIHDNKGTAQNLNAGFSVATGEPKLPFDKYVDCDKQSPPGSVQPVGAQNKQFCAQVAVLSAPAAGVEGIFQNASPSVQTCGKKVLPEPTKSLVLDDFPSPQDFFAPQFAQVFARSAAARGSTRPGRRDLCITHAPSRVVKWDFGDGTTIDSPQGGIADKVHHVYAAAGSYSLKLVADVPYELKPGENGDAPDEWRYQRSERTYKVDVAKPYCGPIKVRGIPVVPTVQSAKDVQAGSEGCFLVGSGSTPTYKTFPGYRLELGGLPLQNPEGLVVEPAKSSIAPATLGQSVVARFPHTGGVALPVGAGVSDYVGETAKLAVPPQQPDSALGVSAAKISAIAAPVTVGGLPAKQVEAYASTSGGPFLKAAVDLPPPLGPGTPPVVIDASTAGQAARLARGSKGAAHGKALYGVPVDFTVDVGEQELGPFELPGAFVLGHKLGGGWIGGGKIAIPKIGTIDAPYAPAPAQAGSDQCSQITGPSGISLGSSGNFEFGGAALTNTSIPLGPVATLNCVAVKGKATPFVLEGRAAGTVPPPGPFSVNSCFFFAVLAAGETLSPGCGVDPWTAPGKTAWLRAQGKVKLFDSIDLGDGAFVDIKAGGSTAIHAGGSVSFVPIDTWFLTIKFAAGVKGAVVLDPLGYHLIGSTSICVENIGPNIGCHNIGQAGVSSKGMGFCTSIASGVRYWGGGLDWWWGNCDLQKKIGVARPIVRGANGRPRLRGGGLNVPKGLDQVGFAVTGEPGGGSPVVAVEGPDRHPTKIVDTGEPFQQTHGYDVIHGVDETLVVVRTPKGGDWSVTPQPGSPPVSIVGLRLPIAKPKITAAVERRGRRRILVYDASLARGDKLSFVEEGRSVSGRLGPVSVQEGSGQIRIPPTPGVGGKRKVIAYIDRNGVPYKQLRVATYKAPEPRRLRAPAELEVFARRTAIRVLWRRVRGARSYEIIVRLADGRVLRERTKKPRLKISDLPAGLRARLRVVAVDAALRESKAAKGRVRTKRPKPLVLRP